MEPSACEGNVLCILVQRFNRSATLSLHSQLQNISPFLLWQGHLTFKFGIIAGNLNKPAPPPPPPPPRCPFLTRKNNPASYAMLLEVRDATMVFKCLNVLAPPYLCQKFKTRSEVHNCNTRNRDRLHIPLCRTAAGQRAFTFRGQRLWNSLPDEFQSITNSDVFKVKIKQHFLRVFLEN